MPRPRATLGTSLTLALAGITLVVGSVQGLVLLRWGESLGAAAAELREAASRAAESMVDRTLGGAQLVASSLAEQSAAGVVDTSDPLAVEKVLLARLLENPDLTEATFTRGHEGETDVGGTWQVSVFREGTPGALVTILTRGAGGEFLVDRRARPAGERTLRDTPLARGVAPGVDPTTHDTFVTTLQHHRYSDAPLWTDIHYAERDEERPVNERRVVVTVMQAVEDQAGRVVGVARVGLLASRLDDVTRIPVDARDPHDPHRVFLADDRGRLITRIHPDQSFVEDGEDVRPDEAVLPGEVRAALLQPVLRDVGPETPRLTSRFEVSGRSFVLSAFSLTGGQDWRVGVLVPEDYALAGLRQVRLTALAASLGALAVLAVAAAIGLRSVRGSLEGIVATSDAMTRFDFAPRPFRSPFRDTFAVMEGLEQAKTALRAMRRYVPVELVRELYRERRDPVLGGELRDVTLLFTDIEGFTTLSERVPPDRLARLLGVYFESLTAAIHASGGTVDKYIGDAVMALWNAPSRLVDHPARACAAALLCREASLALERESRLDGRPIFRTRLGLHRAEVMVGHFGAPDRIAYTALGDGVNVAARLEGLNKLYGTSILASETVRDAAGEGFVFRLVDRVAVKGRRGGVRVFELLGTPASVDRARRDTAVAYERAFEAHLERRFDEALVTLALHPEDPPSRVLAERCRRFAEAPPPVDWDGTHIAGEK